MLGELDLVSVPMRQMSVDEKLYTEFMPLPTTTDGVFTAGGAKPNQLPSEHHLLATIETLLN